MHQVHVAELEREVVEAEVVAPVVHHDRHPPRDLAPILRDEREVVEGEHVPARYGGRGGHLRAAGHRRERVGDPADVLEVGARRGEPEIVPERPSLPVHQARAGELRAGQHRPRDVEGEGIAPDLEAAGEVPHAHRGVAHLHREGVHLRGDGAPVGRAHREAREAARQALQADHPLHPLGARRDLAALAGPFRAQGLHRRRGRPRLRRRIPGGAHLHAPRDDQQPTELDQRRRAPARALAQPEDLLQVRPAGTALDDHELRLHQHQPVEHHPAGQEVGQPVLREHPREARERPPGVIQDDEVAEGDPAEERPPHGADADVPAQQTGERLGRGAREQGAAGGRRRERRGQAEGPAQQRQDGGQPEAEGMASHQKACPTAKWIV